MVHKCDGTSHEGVVMSTTSMAEMKMDVGIRPNEAELRIEERTGLSRKVVRLQGVLVGAAPRVGEMIEVEEEKFKVVEVSHKFSVSSLKHVVVVIVQKPQPTVAQDV
jgi:hypothetical protein